MPPPKASHSGQSWGRPILAATTNALNSNTPVCPPSPRPALGGVSSYLLPRLPPHRPPPSPPAPSSAHPEIYPLLALRGRVSLVNTKKTLSHLRAHCSDFPFAPRRKGTPSLTASHQAQATPAPEPPTPTPPPSLPPFQLHWLPALPPVPGALLPQDICTCCSTPTGTLLPMTFHSLLRCHLLREEHRASSKEGSTSPCHIHPPPCPAQNLSPSEVDLLILCLYGLLHPQECHP